MGLWRSKKFKLKIRLFWPLFIFAACVCGAFLHFWSERRAENFENHLISILHTRAENTLWAVENAARLFSGEPPEKISQLLMQMARQPGVAWLAIVSGNGLIISDSNPALVGKRLYTAREMAELNPQVSIQGRFSPDEPEIFEVWKLLKPTGSAKEGATLFAALNFSPHGSLATEFSTQLRWRLFLLGFSIFSLVAIFHLAFQFKKSSKKLGEARAAALQVYRHFPDGLLVTDARGKITAYNENFLALLGKPGFTPATLAELPGFAWPELINPHVGKGFQQNSEIALPDDRILLTRVIGIYSDQDNPAGFLFITRDKTALEKAKTREEEQGKFAALGKVMAGIAHEIRNPLGAICGYASWLSERLPEAGGEKKAALILLQEGERLNNVLSEMLTLTRTPKLRKSAITVGDLFDKLALLASPDAAARNLQIKTVFNPPELEDMEINVDKDKFMQALLNLLLNAIQASPEKCAIIMEASLKKTDSVPEISFSIRDFGPGLSQAVAAEMFTPYYTSKANGTGLGLPLAKSVVESHGGAIEGHNAERGGAIFKITLPLNSHV